MGWLLLAAVGFALVFRLARRRRSLFVVSPSESISTLHVAMSRKQTAKTRAALEAATGALR
jgi:hypothetical protein